MEGKVPLVTGITLTFALGIIIDLTSSYSSPGSAVMLHRKGSYTCYFFILEEWLEEQLVPALPVILQPYVGAAPGVTVYELTSQLSFFVISVFVTC